MTDGHVDQLVAQAYVQQFAKWCAKHNGEELDKATLRDYVNNFTPIYSDGYFRVIEVNMGAFDHGAGAALLIVQGNLAWVAYEDSMTQFTKGKELMNLP